jgi:thiol-disulfide isomerase/thioredoxin
MFEKYLSSETKVVGLLYSASYCKWCKDFMPLVKEIYPYLKDIEILFVGSDKTEETFIEYSKDHPWSTIPYNDPMRVKARSLYDVTTIPALVFVKPDGSMIEPNGRHILVALMKDMNNMEVCRQLSLRFGIDNEHTEIDYNSDDSDW